MKVSGQALTTYDAHRITIRIDEGHEIEIKEKHHITSLILVSEIKRESKISKWDQEMEIQPIREEPWLFEFERIVRRIENSREWEIECVRVKEMSVSFFC